MKVKIDVDMAIKRNYTACDFIYFCKENRDRVFDISEFRAYNNSKFTHYINVGSCDTWYFYLGEDLVEFNEYSVDIDSIIQSAYKGV